MSEPTTRPQTFEERVRAAAQYAFDHYGDEDDAVADQEAEGYLLERLEEVGEDDDDRRAALLRIARTGSI